MQKQHRKWRAYKRSELKECRADGPGCFYLRQTWTFLACVFVCVYVIVGCQQRLWVLSNEGLHAESVEINVIIPQLLLIRVINTQCKQETASAFSPLSFSRSLLSGMALREQRHLEKVRCWPHFSRDSHLHIIHFQRAEGAAKRILNCASTVYNIDKCLYLGPLMRNH